MSTKRKEVRTYAVRREYLIAAAARRRRTLKLKAIETLSGKSIIVCVNCHREIEYSLHTNEAVDILYRQLHSGT